MSRDLGGIEMSYFQKDIAYIGCPYGDPDPNIRKFREQAVTQMVFDLREQGIYAYSPITHNMPVDRLGVFGDFKSWMEFDHNMLSRCDKLFVLKLPGWQNSKGLAAEIAFAKSQNIPIEEIEPTDDFLEKVTCTENSSDPMSKLLAQFRKMIAERDWEQFHSAKNLAMILQVESSEVAEHFVWLTEEQSNHIAPNQKQEVADELADVFINLLLLSDKFGIDLWNASFQKIEKIKQKYPVALSKGKATKYTVLQ